MILPGQHLHTFRWHNIVLLLFFFNFVFNYVIDQRHVVYLLLSRLIKDPELQSLCILKLDLFPASQSILPAADGLFQPQFQVQPHLTVLPVLHLLRLPLPTQLRLSLLHLDGHLALPLLLLIHRLPLPVELVRLQSPSPTAAAASTGAKQRDAAHAQWKEG